MKVEDAISAATARWAAPGEAGGVVALFADGRITRSWCMGLADIESGRGWTTATPTRLAALTTHVPAGAACALGLAGPLGRHLPELRGPLAATTLSRALTMTSGIPDLGETLALSGISPAASIGAERL
ncbi:MAG: serine hydrolase, partial [Alphaproteobacteria bacterium]